MCSISCDGQVKAFVVKETHTKTLDPIVINNVDKSALLFTDQHGGYQKLSRIYNRTIVNHSVCEFVKWIAITNGVESLGLF